MKKTTAVKQTAPKKAAARGSAATHQERQGTIPEERQRMIAEAAYLIAERRGLQGDRALDDWLQAEAEVDARSAAKH